MSAESQDFIQSFSEYKYGFSTDVETEQIPKGLSVETIYQISGKKRMNPTLCWSFG